MPSASAPVTSGSSTSVEPGESTDDTANEADLDGGAAMQPIPSGSADGQSPSEGEPTASGDAGDMPSSDPSTDPSASSDPPSSDCEAVADEQTVVGYGAQATGGGNSEPIEVASFSEAEAALEAYRDDFESGARSALVLRYTGSFDFSSISDVCAQHEKAAQVLQIKEMQNVTFEGSSGSSGNFGIKINRAKNVVVRNLTLGLLPGGGSSDAITIEGNGTNGDVEHVWIDHNDLFSSTKDDCEGAGDTEFDGLIDIKNGARNITLSYNHLHDHQKTGLLGSSDSDDFERYVTFHHNWYENVVSRTPLQRGGYVHLYNNYFDHILDSGINVRMGGIALVEANYFENAANPVTSRYSDVAGFWDLQDNHVGDGVTWSLTEDTLANADDWQSTATFPAEELTYAIAADAAECVKTIVTARAGATLEL